ncbi:hypothetical protein [Methanogenium organophilum]|uniref:Uncharacterized protein n=1 Tax=Methanogenium organophilum TaxID=2199 RepID=A0A9X9S2F4_METOG|nr:hypothetical protein [Methanogenium organophilum]WAI00584.1 hypothetical protein OU421_09110 [Methanogenium organophilum]
MKRGVTLLISLMLALCLVQGVAAADFVESVADVDPASGDLAPGDQVIVHVIVKLTGSGDTTFDTDDELEAYTELEDPEWDYTILVNSQGIPKESTSRYLRLLGWDLSYPDSNEVTIDYALVGKVPDVTQTSDLTLYRLRQMDANGNIPSGGELLIERTVINPEDVDKIRDLREEQLEELSTSIDEYTALGVNVVQAGELYTQADEKIDQSKTASYSQANVLLTEAGALIEEAEGSLEDAYSAKLIDDAQVTIDAVNSDVNYFINNRSMTGDTRVTSIQNKVSLAETQMSQAKDFRDNKDYYQSRLNANEAQLTANEALTMSTELREEIGEGGLLPDFSGLGTYVIIIVAVVIIAGIGFVIYRRFNKWDELG